MLKWINVRRPERRFAVATTVLALALAVGLSQSAFALIEGGEGNDPVRDPGWPKGAAEIVNNPARIAYWIGPPFGGGQFHAEYRGEAQTLNAILAQFARLEVKTKGLVLHDGVGQSFWLNINREPAKEAAARMDWSFMVWEPRAWKQLQQMPAELKPADVRNADAEPPTQIDVYTGGNVRWADVTVPKGLTVIDQRLEAHGFEQTDGIVLEGKVFDLATQQPLAGKMRLERIDREPKSGYRYTAVAEAAAEAKGRWVLKNAPAGWHRVVVTAEGYVPRVAGYGRFDDQPAWHFYECGLVRPAQLAGQVSDATGKPLVDVEVRLTDVVVGEDERYQVVDEFTAKTDADGRFQFDQVPEGRARVRVSKPGYCPPRLGELIATPAKDVALGMMKAANLRVTVDFSGTVRPEAYIVEIEPEGGSAVGTWGGSGHIDASNQISFENAPPGRYVLAGHPNPSSADERTDPVTVELKGGETTEVTLKAR
ncbi:MAG: carboxypeptidase regulatory-like domain-containing protein [Planctomycetota bacterium]